jgi:hypothetical protein
MLPDFLVLLKALEECSLADNPITDPPAEVLRLPFPRVLGYLAFLFDGRSSGGLFPQLLALKADA